MRGFVNRSSTYPQDFAKVGARSDYSRLRRSEEEGGAGGGRSPPPAPPSPERLACEPFCTKETTFAKP
ncbi:MAG TPA: hypothetical protein VFB60_08840 [Ktedonobacteraceae bacterium]|nr:hypothetical protein [Ktedonobacteraceae bacterium]